MMTGDCSLPKNMNIQFESKHTMQISLWVLPTLVRELLHIRRELICMGTESLLFGDLQLSTPRTLCAGIVPHHSNHFRVKMH